MPYQSRITTLIKLLTPATVVALGVGCASKPKDTTPLVSTSVLKAEYSVNGQVVPDFTGEQTVYTLEDKRRLDHKTKFDSFLMRWANSDTSDIARVDRKLMWNLDHDDKKYTECPLKGCPAEQSWLEKFENKTSQDSESEEYESYEEKSCDVKLAKNDFTVKPTGKSRVISGLDTQEYQVEWNVAFEDTKGKQDLNQVSFVFWNTKPNQTMKQAWVTHEKFQKAVYEEMKGNPLMRLLGEDAYMSIAAFTGDIEKENNKAMNSIHKKLNKVKGYPISLKLEWYQKNEACKTAKAKTQQQEFDITDGVGAVTSLASNFLSKQADKIVDEWKKDPMVRYVYEVKDVSIKDVRSSKFDLPNKYELENRE